jgi:adenine-specific DNA-methyltransferase
LGRENWAREEGESLIAEIREHLVAASEGEAGEGEAREGEAGEGEAPAEPSRRGKGSAGASPSHVEAALAALARLQAISKPFLNWAGKAERLSFDVPTLPLFVHERLSTKAIIETLTGHRRSKETQKTIFEMFADPEHSVTDQVLRAYEYRWAIC